MHRDYCTYLDTNYLTRGIALFESLREHGGDFRLRVVCFDDLSHIVMSAYDGPELEAIHVAELEKADPDLVATRIQRSHVEYMWTSTPCVTRWLQERDGLEELTYLDADMWFFSSPEPAFDALGDGSVLLTPGDSSPAHYSRRAARRAGLFAVQFMTFRRDADGHAALGWWRERCLDWCYARYSNGRVGDQLYLNDFPRLFGGIRMLGHPGALGPWNIESRQITRDAGGNLLVDGKPLIFYHFAGLGVFAGFYRPAAGRFAITPEEQRLIYDPYVARLRELRSEIAAEHPALPAEPVAESLRWRLQRPVSRALGALGRARARVLPRALAGPYVPGGYTPAGYEPDARTVARATNSTSSSVSSG